MEYVEILIKVVQIVIIPIVAYFTKEILTLRRDVDRIYESVARAHANIEMRPTREEISVLGIAMESIKGDIKSQNKWLENIDSHLNRITDVVQKHYTAPGGK